MFACQLLPYSEKGKSVFHKYRRLSMADRRFRRNFWWREQGEGSNRPRQQREFGKQRRQDYQDEGRFGRGDQRSFGESDYGDEFGGGYYGGYSNYEGGGRTGREGMRPWEYDRPEDDRSRFDYGRGSGERNWGRDSFGRGGHERQSGSGSSTGYGGYDEGSASYSNDWDTRSFRPGYGERDYGEHNRSFGGGGYGDSEYEQEPTFSYTEIWYIPGPYTGYGPEGYNRSDERIHEDVCERLTQHGQVDASRIHLEVKNGEVTLRGSVPNRRMKRMVEDTVESVMGVSDVHNELRVPREGEGDRSQGQGQAQSHAQSQTQVSTPSHDLGQEQAGEDSGQI
jgi:osmotically-inducible protein OsmY